MICSCIANGCKFAGQEIVDIVTKGDSGKGEEEEEEGGNGERVVSSKEKIGRWVMQGSTTWGGWGVAAPK